MRSLNCAMLLLLGLALPVVPGFQVHAQELAPRPETTITRCKTVPVIDGSLEDPCWKEAVPLGSFSLFKGKGKTSDAQIVKTSDAQIVKLAFDDEWLYLGIAITLPHPEAVTQRAMENDGNLSIDDSVEIFLDPGTTGATYYHYMVTAFNVRGERRCLNQGASKETGWNIPWRSATKITKTGWQTELAVPLAIIFDSGAKGAATMNIGVNRVLPTLNYMGVPISTVRETASWAPVLSTFHAPERFGVVKGLESVKPRMPFLVAARNVEVSRYAMDEQGAFSYDVSGTLEHFGDRPGKVIVAVDDKPGAGPGRTERVEVDLAAEKERPFSIRIPITNLSDRTAELRLRDPATGEALQTIVLREMVSLMRTYARYSYITTEKNAEVVCEIGLPEGELRKAKLVAKNKTGQTLVEVRNLSPRTIVPIPASALAVGQHPVMVELQRQAGEVMISQEAMLVKREPKPGCEWKIDRSDKVILNNGRPFFPFGIMCRSLNEGDVKPADIADMGFNTVVRFGSDPYDKIEVLLEQGRKHNFYVIDFPKEWKYKPAPGQEPKAGMNPEESREWLLNDVWIPGVKRLMNHPNLMAWYLADEPGNSLENAARILDTNTRVYGVDGYHPTEVLYIPPVPDGSEFSRHCDILGVDPYWVPGGGAGDVGNPNSVGRQTWVARQRADRDLKLAWITPCAEYFSGTRMRIFNEAEQRVQTYLSLIHGASGLLYFVYPFNHELTRDTFARLGAEMKILGPACATPAVPQRIRYTPVTFDPANNVFPDVQVSLKRNPDGGYILLAANPRAYPAEMTCTIPALGKAGKVRRLFAPKHAVELKDGVFTDLMQPMDTRAYAVEGLPDGTTPIEIAVDLKTQPEKADPFYTKVAVPDCGLPGKKNLLRNSGFETCSITGMPDYYTDFRTPQTAMGYRKGDPRGDCGWGVDTNRPYEGRQSLRINGSYLLFRVTPKIEKPTPFVFSAWVRGETNTAIQFYGAGRDKKKYRLTDTWQRISEKLTLLPDVPYGADLYGFSINAPQTNAVWIDAMQFEQGTNLTDYVP